MDTHIGYKFIQGCILVSYLKFVEYSGPIIWPKILEVIDYYQIKDFSIVHFILPPIIHIISLVIVNLFFLVLYKLDHPLIEQYKINSEPWPWQKDKNEWNKLLKKTIIQVSFNGIVMIPIFILL